MPSWIFVALGVAVLFLLLRRFVGGSDPADVWRQLAEGLGLRFEAGGAAGPSVRGRYRDVEVRITAERPVGARSDAPPSAVIQAEIPLPGTVGVWGAASQRQVDGQDPWSRPGRDALALVRAHNSRSVVVALDRPEVLEHARDFLGRHPQARIADDWVTLVVPGPVREARRLHQLLDDVASMARAFREEEPGAAPAKDDPWAEGWGGAGAGASATGGDRAGPRTEPRPNPYAAPAGPGSTTRPFEPPQAFTLPKADPAIASRWKRRTAVAYLLGLIPAGLGASLAIIGGLRVDGLLYGLGGIWWVIIGGGGFGLGLIVFSTAYHCPKCGRFLRSPRSGRVVFDPEHCPQCSVRLRDSHRPHQGAGPPPPP